MLRTLFVLICVTTVCNGIPTVAERRRFARERAAERIVGGEDIDISRAPYQVSLEAYRYTVCGGSIISTRYILTEGATCAAIYFPGELLARVGSTRAVEGGTAIPIKEMFFHPNFDYFYFEYDVAVLELETPVVLSDTVAIIPLGNTEPAEGDTVLVSGWGTQMQGNNTNSDTLKAVELPVVSRQTCKKAYDDFRPVSARMFCSGGQGKGTCYRDQGDPAVVDGVLVGLVSWHRDCANEASPVVYTNIAHPSIRSFISEYVNA